MTPSILADITRKKNGADDPPGDDRGSGGHGADDTTSASASASSSSASSSSASASSSSSSASSSSASSSSSSAASSSSSSSTDSASSASSSASSASSSSSASSASSASSSSSTDDSTSPSLGSSASSASSSASSSSSTSASSSPSNSTDDGPHQRGQHGSFLFDADTYLALNPDLGGKVDLSGALQHYLSIGGTEDRSPTRWFDADFYRASHEDLTRGGFDDATLFQHYNLYGVWEGRAPSAAFAQFDGARYLRENPDVDSYVRGHLDDFLGSIDNGAIAHFMIYGAHEARHAFEDNGRPIDPGLFA